MDNTVFERNYEKPQDDMEYCTAVFEQAVEGGFFQRYCDMVDKVPKIINPQDKENYEYLVNRCDQYAKRHYGRISAVVDYERWDSKINLYLPMLEFTTEEDSLYREGAFKSKQNTLGKCVSECKGKSGCALSLLGCKTGRTPKHRLQLGRTEYPLPYQI